MMMNTSHESRATEAAVRIDMVALLEAVARELGREAADLTEMSVEICDPGCAEEALTIEQAAALVRQACRVYAETRENGPSLMRLARRESVYAARYQAKRMARAHGVSYTVWRYGDRFAAAQDHVSPDTLFGAVHYPPAPFETYDP